MARVYPVNASAYRHAKPKDMKYADFTASLIILRAGRRRLLCYEKVSPLPAEVVNINCRLSAMRPIMPINYDDWPSEVLSRLRRLRFC